MKAQITRLRGMTDLLPAQVAQWQHLETVVRHVMQRYGYGEMRTPMLERTALFHRSIGEATDIVEKEMYSFPDRNAESVSLRPENTAGCVRAVIENGLLQPGSTSRIWYCGPMFRYERPQLGRQRQFHQVGAEVYGLGGPLIEAELILLSAQLWKLLDLNEAVQLEVNSLGSPADRASYRNRLVDYFQGHRNQLDEDSLRRLEHNPLRILDSKNPEMQALIEAAPTLRNSLSDESQAHYRQLLELLESQGIPVVENQRLVRGLDYYSHTVFEWTTTHLGSQSAICAGGRYDGLLEQLGAKSTPGVGWALGMERVIALIEAIHGTTAQTKPDVFVIATDDVPATDSLRLAEFIRDSLPASSVLHNTAAGSLKSQFRKADKSGAVVAVVLGADELQQGTVTVKALRSGDTQRTVTRNELPAAIQELLITCSG